MPREAVELESCRSSYRRKQPKEGSMQYMLLIYGDESAWQGRSDAERDQVIQSYGAFTQELQQAGAMVAGDALQPTQTATTVRVHDGETLTTDGPFAETKEQLGGYYLIEADSLDDAIEWAAKVPAVREGSVEVRPVMVFEGTGA
jgi:hypothetical protein